MNKRTFFDIDGTADMDVVIGNPPYVRYQPHRGADRQRSRLAAKAAGVELNELASIWAAFAVHATSFLAPGGRMALVLPAELMFVNYAGVVRAMLLERFATVHLAVFEERLFADAQEEVVLLLAEGYQQGPSGHFQPHQFRNAQDLAQLGSGTRHEPRRAADRWTGSLVGLEAQGILAAASAQGHFATLKSWGETSLGAVTGNNKWFTFSSDEIHELGLPEADLIRISPPGSRHLRGLELDQPGWEQSAGPWSGDLSVQALGRTERRGRTSCGQRRAVQRGPGLQVQGALAVVAGAGAFGAGPVHDLYER
ncbi:N-6 DNA methylase [Glutamicibacter halophytocola]|uniref:Eco57I restriction-modification methylase domain-containing protein n=1 Tax=Glutamicibacter halophytocola TaxID=1933880 RepID=UPI0032196344